MKSSYCTEHSSPNLFSRQNIFKFRDDDYTYYTVMNAEYYSGSPYFLRILIRETRQGTIEASEITCCDLIGLFPVLLDEFVEYRILPFEFLKLWVNGNFNDFLKIAPPQKIITLVRDTENGLR